MHYEIGSFGEFEILAEKVTKETAAHGCFLVAVDFKAPRGREISPWWPRKRSSIKKKKRPSESSSEQCGEERRWEKLVKII